MSIRKQLIIIIAVFLLASLTLFVWFSPLQAFRVVIGFAVVLFVPGYACSFVLWDIRQVTFFERCAVAIALSIVLMPLSMLVENHFDIGITAISASSTAIALTFLGIAFTRLTVGYRRKHEANNSINKSS